MLPRIALPVLLLLAARAAEPATLRHLPGAANVTGRNGARFESTVWVANLGAAEGVVTIGLVPGAGAAPAPVARTLRAGETLTLANPLRSLFGLEESFGTLTFASDLALAVRGKTVNVSQPAGTYGVDLFTLEPGETLLAGETAHLPFVANSADGSRGSRTNLAVALLAPGTSVVLTLYDETGLVRGVRSVSSPSPVTWQAAVAEIAGDAELPLARAELTVRSGEAAAYAAVVDNVTGDGLLVPAVRSGRTGTDWILNGAAKTAGANGTAWTTDVRLFNPSLDPLAVTLAPLGLAGTPITRTVPPRGLLELADVLGAGGLALGDGQAGALRITAAHPFLPAARVVNRGGGGSFGAFLPLVRASAFAGGALVGLSDVSGATGFRTNLALLAPNGTATGTLELRDAVGTVRASAPFQLAGGTWRQTSLRSWLGVDAVPEGARLDVFVLTGGVDAFASVIDNGTGDPVLVRAVARPLAGCSAATVRSFTASPSSVAPGGETTLHLDADAGPSVTVVPGDLPIAPGGSVTVRPAASSAYRAVLSGGCSVVASEAAAVSVVPPSGVAATESGFLRAAVASGAAAYRGIPYAAPPTGPLRFRPPVSPETWSGVRDAASFGPICPQIDDGGHYVGAEDCLSLNVFSPDPPPAAPAPVLVFVHGGANFQGASSLDVYDGRALAKQFGVVVVTLNYRLGALGYLALTELDGESPRHVSGNYGILDQVAALSWVKRNVASFGGDPERLLLFGQSAGGYDSCALLVSPLAKGLFSRVLFESGGCARVPLADVETFGRTIAQAAGCGSASDAAACLRGKSAEQVVLAVPGQSPVYATTGQLYGYAVDGFVIPEDPTEAIRAGRHHRMPFVLGNTSDETARDTPLVLTPLDFQTQVYAHFGFTIGNQVLVRYPLSAYPSPFRALVAVTTDARWLCPGRRLARAAAAGQTEPFYRYSFAHALDSGVYSYYGAYHGLDVPFVFQGLDLFPGYTPSSGERGLALAMGGYWTRFAATGDPNGGGAPAWPLYDAARDSYLTFDTPIRSAEGVRTSQCDFWDSVTAP